ncbi:DUF3592 domain-containing protein [Ruminococcus sp.]|uniref:DUF3592 domain-containing protein n=1 Tax=Ruminococcus sp. TaxID=41978 RepID=UPI0025E9FFD6|nr:DUF3592 domain-containing protein [Ruminococcus sp.]MBQ8967017.1 hypothetical protein [Ruminococcus sp.]
MDMTKLLLMAEEEKNPFDGLFSGAGRVVGIILIVTGVLLIYLAVKVAKGYSFMPTLGTETVIEEDNYVECEAKVLQKKKTTMPDLNGGEDREFVEWKIGYTVDGEKFTQMIPDDGYEKGDMLKIKYNPDKPSEYYLVDENADNEAPDEEEDTSADTNKSRNTGAIIAVLGVLVIIGGIALVLM